jgi:putative heme-binding domain-containing protein
MPAFNHLGDEKIRAIVRELRSLQGKSATQIASGNPASGKELFFGKAGCADCHAMNGQGRFVATDLTDFAYNHDSDEIQEAILNPQGQGIPSMVSVAVVTKTGQQFSGMARNENNSSVQIQDSEGRFFLFAKSDIRSMERSAGPAMPENYQQRLTATEVIDIVSYLVHQTSVPAVAGSQAAKGNKRWKEK